VGGSCQACERLCDSPRRSVKELACREHLVLAWTKGEQGPCVGVGIFSITSY